MQTIDLHLCIMLWFAANNSSVIILSKVQLAVVTE